MLRLPTRRLLLALIALPWLLPALAAQVPDPFGNPFDSKMRIAPLWSVDQARPGDRVILGIKASVDAGWYIKPGGVHEKPGTIPTAVTLEGLPNSITFEQPHFPKPQLIEYSVVDPITGKHDIGYDGDVVFFVPMMIGTGTPEGELKFQVEVSYQACDDSQCVDPSPELATVSLPIVAAGTAVAAANEAVFADFEKLRAESAAAVGVVGFDLFGLEFKIDTKGSLGFLLLLLVAMLGGALLNFTPCVLPVIPIKIMSLSKSAGNRGRCLALGVAMSLGIVAFWLGLGVLIASFTGFTATNQLFQYPAFTIGVGVLIAVLAVGMCGLFSIQLPNWLLSVSPRDDTMVGSFGLGVMTAVLSTLSTAPFMGAAAAWAATQTAATTLTTFAAIGLGMALPYVVLSAFPGMARSMPRSGAAAEVIKQIMGLLLLAAAAYFIGTGLAGVLVSPPEPPTKLHWWVVMGISAAAGIWMAWRTLRIAESGTKRAVFGLLGLLIAVGSVFGAFSLTAKGPIDWVYYTEARFAQQRGKVVVMDFTAEWCLNCKALEHNVLNRDDVVKKLASADVVPMKVDITGNNPEGNDALTRAGRRSIPLLVVFDKDGKEVWKSDAYTAGQVLDAIEKAGGEPQRGE